MSFSIDVFQQFFVPFLGLLEDFPLPINSIELFVLFLFAGIEIDLEFAGPFDKGAALLLEGRQMLDIGAFNFIFFGFIGLSDVEMNLGFI